MAKHSTDILTWARRGAEARWQELQAEVASLVKAFPHLGGTGGARTRGGSGRSQAVTATPKRRRSAMSAAQRKAVSARMKKYWAERRKASK